MRDLGDISWLNKYIGIPYKFGGRDVDGLDCYGLPKLIYSERYELELPDWVFDKIDLKDINGKIVGAVTSGDFEPLDRPDEGCFAVCYRTRAAHHIGLYYGGGIIHCTEGRGVVYQPRSQFESDYVKVVYGVWMP